MTSSNSGRSATSGRRRRTALGTAVACAIASTMGLVAAPGGASTGRAATPPAASSPATIAFGSDRFGGTHNIFVMNADGSHVRQLTFVKAKAGADLRQRWSPDGTKLVFEHRNADGSRRQIWVMKADGSGQQVLFDDPSFHDFNPSYSPDGSRIAFARCRIDVDACALFSMSARGADVTPITTFDVRRGVLDGQPVYSPDGKTIVFTSMNRDGVASAIYLANTDGSHVRRITQPAWTAEDPAWVPGGTRVAFSTHCCSAGRPAIWSIGVDGRNLVKLTAPGRNDSDFAPEYSSDGSRIAFERDASDGADSVVTMNADGSGQTPIQSDAFLPVWTPTPRSASLATGVKRMVSARTAARFAMPLPAFTTMQSVNLGAGAWTVIGKATAVDSGPVDIARCRLVDGSTALDTSAVQVSGSHRAETLTNVATVVVPAGTTARLLQQCGHDQSNGDSVSIDPDASLVAFQTRDGTAAGQSIVRTTAQTPLPEAGAIVLSQSLPPGNYAAGFKVTAVSFSGPAVVDCRLTFAGPSGAAIAMVGSATDVVTRSFFTHLTGGGTVSLFCTGSDTSSVYLDPDAVLWVRQAKSYTAVYGGCGAFLVNGTTDLIAMLRLFEACNIQTTPNLSSASISKGSWVALGGESRLINDAASGDFVRCTLSTDATHLDGSSEWVDPSTYTGVTVLGAVKATRTVTVIEGCASDANGPGRSFAGSLILIRI